MNSTEIRETSVVGGSLGSSQKRIVFLESAAEMGGVQFSTLNLVRRLDRIRWEPHVICPGEGDLSTACRSTGATVEVLPTPRLFSTSVCGGNGNRLPNPLAWAWNGAAIRTQARRLADYLRDCRPDLIVTKGMSSHVSGGLAARRIGVPCVWHVQDFISERLLGIYRRGFGHAARRLPIAIVADGAAIARQLPQEIQGRVRVIHNGIDLDEFQPSQSGASVRDELGIPERAIIIGNVARMTPWKGQHYILEAFARIAMDAPQARLLLVGAALFDGDGYERLLRKRASALGLSDRAVFAGYRKDLPRLLAAMDVFAYSSTEKDTSPLALLSAMAAGLPIVAFDIDGVREVLEGGREGILVPVKHVDFLAKALGKLVANAHLREAFGRAARGRAEADFSIERYVSRMEETFAQVLGQSDQ